VFRETRHGQAADQLLDALALVRRRPQPAVRVLDRVIQLLDQLVLLSRALRRTAACDEVQQASARRAAARVPLSPGIVAEQRLIALAAQDGSADVTLQKGSSCTGSL
jgi:hypothetical protein